MKSFRKALPDIIKRCGRAKGTLLLFDFDGTLSEIVAHPNQAKMIKGWEKKLSRLKKHKNLEIGIVTGRSLADIRSKVGIPGIIYAASHGYRITKGGKNLLTVGKEHVSPLKKLANKLKREITNIKGAQVEFKEFAIAIHYRRVAQKDRSKVTRIVTKLAQPELDLHGWQITKGKMVVEVRPALTWNKGHAVKWIWKNLAPNFLPCYIGDDITDEDAFAAIGKSGITIRVGKKRNSKAKYLVQRINEIEPWLDSLEANTK